MKDCLGTLRWARIFPASCSECSGFHRGRTPVGVDEGEIEQTCPRPLPCREGARSMRADPTARTLTEPPCTCHASSASADRCQAAKSVAGSSWLSPIASRMDPRRTRRSVRIHGGRRDREQVPGSHNLGRGCRLHRRCQDQVRLGSRRIAGRLRSGARSRRRHSRDPRTEQEERHQDPQRLRSVRCPVERHVLQLRQLEVKFAWQAPP